MAVTHSTTARNAIANAAVALLDSGSTNATGRLVFKTSGGSTTIATLNLSNPSFGSASSGTATANAIASATVAASGTIAQAELQDRNATGHIFCAVATSGSDINLSSVAVNSGDTISISSLSYSAPS
jgi:hypothetical protein